MSKQSLNKTIKEFEQLRNDRAAYLREFLQTLKLDDVSRQIIANNAGDMMFYAMRVGEYKERKRLGQMLESRLSYV